MNDLKPHIFVRHPDRKKNTCWSCDAAKEMHQYVVQQTAAVVPAVLPKSTKKGNARSLRHKTSRMRAVR